MRDIPKPYEVYKHFKGNKYQIIAIATDSEDGTKKVVYQALYEPFGIYVRDLEMFMSKVDREKYPNAGQEYRFERVICTEKSDTVHAVLTANVQTANVQNASVHTENVQINSQSYEGVDDGLMKFLGARTNSEKLDVLVSMKNRLDDKILRSMAVSLDLQLKEGASIMEQYDQIKSCLFLKQKYEQTRR